MKKSASRKKSDAIPAAVRRAYQDAVKTRKAAHAPYSGFFVGAGVVARGGKVFTGCNVENCSYGGAICAERTAIVKAVSEGAREFTDIVVVTDAAEPAFPCGFCRQVMAEFFEPATRIWIANLRGIKSMHTFGELLPMPFGPQQLRGARE